jgi:type VI secretion system secreted protein Hcp
MKKFLLAAIVTAAFIFIAGAASAAMVENFLKIEGIAGESQDVVHKGEIDVENWTFGGMMAGIDVSSKTPASARAQIQPFQFTMKVNRASALLFQFMATGQHIQKATLTCRKAGKAQNEFLKVTFSDVMVSGLKSTGTSAADNLPIDQVSLNFARIEIEYREMRPDGTAGNPVKSVYDLRTGKAQ